MKNLMLSVTASIGLMICGGFLVTQAYHVGVAQAQEVSPPPQMDAGTPLMAGAQDAGIDPAAPIVTTPAANGVSAATTTSNVVVPDPLEDPGGFYNTMVQAKKKSAWLGLILVGLYGLIKALGYASGKFSILSFFKGAHVAMVISGAGVLLAASVDALFLGGATSTVLMAGLWALVGWLGTAKPAPTPSTTPSS